MPRVQKSKNENGEFMVLSDTEDLSQPANDSRLLAIAMGMRYRNRFGQYFQK